MSSAPFTVRLAVRDYECDLQGIVNNAVYQNYLEHARHEYLKSIGIDFKKYADEGINFVVIRVELDYKLPLTSGDQFDVTVTPVRESAVKFAFLQDILRASDNRPVLRGKVIGTAINRRGRPQIPDEVQAIFSAIDQNRPGH